MHKNPQSNCESPLSLFINNSPPPFFSPQQPAHPRSPEGFRLSLSVTLAPRPFRKFLFIHLGIRRCPRDKKARSGDSRHTKSFLHAHTRPAMHTIRTHESHAVTRKAAFYYSRPQARYVIHVRTSGRSTICNTCNTHVETQRNREMAVTRFRPYLFIRIAEHFEIIQLFLFIDLSRGRLNLTKRSVKLTRDRLVSRSKFRQFHTRLYEAIICDSDIIKYIIKSHCVCFLITAGKGKFRVLQQMLQL